MPPSEPSRIFISYARKDGAALAQRLQSDLRNEGFDAWLDTQRIAGGAVWSEEIEGAIKSRGVMVALMSPGSYSSEICRSEQLLALDQGNRVIPVLATKGADRAHGPNLPRMYPQCSCTQRQPALACRI
jgi:TIR domain